MMNVIASATLVSLLGIAPAFATPRTSAVFPAVAPDGALVQVQNRPDWDGDRRRDRDHYRPGHRYDRAPGHWHRYHSRPHDWRRRGCIIVGPVWFCP
jgi:hypothetical protein